MTDSPRTNSTSAVLVGHRGYPAAYPENSLSGFRAGLQAGARAVECDIQFSFDGVPVVMHDADLQRTAGVDADVAALTQAQLAYSSVHEPERFGDRFEPEPVASLADLVNLLLEFPSAVVFVEIKHEAFTHFSREYCAQKVLELVAPLAERAIIISFDAPVLALARDAGARIGWVLDSYSTRSQLEAVALAPEFLICDHRRLPAAPAQLWPGDWQWFVYDVVEPEQARALSLRGVRYIETWDIGALLRHFPQGAELNQSSHF